MNHLQDRLTVYLLARLPRKLAIGVIAFLLTLAFVAACLIFAVVTVVAIKIVIDYPPMGVVYFCFFAFVATMAIVAKHIAERYPARKEKDTDDASAATEPPPPEPKPAANPPGYTLR